MQIEEPARPRGRPREFDINEALDCAVEVFWERGYDGASLGDLTAAMGLNRPSVYAAFGDKHGLFLAALDRYGATLGRHPLDAMLREPDPAEGLRAFLDAAIDLASFGTIPRGCLIACVGAEVAAGDADTRQRVRQAICDMEGSIRAYLAEGQAPEGPDTAATAHVFVSVMQGLAIRARAGVPRDELQRAATAILELHARRPSEQTS